MPWQEFTALLVLATAMSFTPGPNTTLSAALAANGGVRHAVRFVLAVPVGWCLLLGLCAAGLGTLANEQPMLRGAIKVLGISYLLWLAWQMAASRPLASTGNAVWHIGFVQGVLLQFINIKAWLLALTIVAGWVAGQPQWLMRLGIVLPVMAFFAASSNLLYACMGAALRQWLTQGQRLCWFNRGMALLLVATAVWMLAA